MSLETGESIICNGELVAIMFITYALLKSVNGFPVTAKFMSKDGISSSVHGDYTSDHAKDNNSPVVDHYSATAWGDTARDT